jgi:hypothetical protein
LIKKFIRNLFAIYFFNKKKKTKNSDENARSLLNNNNNNVDNGTSTAANADIIVDLKSNNRVSTNEATAISFRQANLFQQRCAFY